MQNNDNIRKLYDALVADNYELGDYEKFTSDISNPEYMRKLYDTMVADDYELGEYNTFSSRYSVTPQGNVAQATQATAQTAQPVVDAYGMPMQPEVSTIEDAPKIPQVNMDEFTVNETYLNNVADNEGAQAPMEGVEIKENLKSNLFKPQSTETPSLLNVGAKPKDYFAEAMGRRLPEAMEERRRKDFAMLSGLAENRKNWTPSSARRYRATSVDQTWHDPYAAVPEEYKALATQKWGKEGSEDAYFSAWMNLSPEEREAFVKREHIKSFFNEETASRMQGIRERALEEKGRGIAKSAMSPMGYNNSAEAAMDRMVQDAGNVGTQTLKALDKAEEIKQAYKNHQLDENFFTGAYKGMKDGLSDIDNWTGLYMVGEMTNLYDIADKMEKGEALSQTEEDFLDAQAYKLAVEAALADDLGWGYGSGNVTGASVPFMLQMLASPMSGASGKAIDKGFATVGRRAIDKFGKGILKKLLTKAPVKKVVKGLVGTVGKGIGQTILFGSDRVAAGTMERHLGNEMVAERANEEFNAGVQAKAGEDLGTALFKAGVSTSMENISEFAGGAFIDDFTKMAGKKIAKEFTDAMGGSVGSRLMRAATNTRAGKALKNLANAKIFTHGANLAKSIERGTQWDGLLNEYLEEVLNNASNVMIGDMTMEDFTSLEKNAETVLGLAWTSGFFMASNATSRIKNYVKGSTALKQTERAARQVFEGEQEKWDAYTQALSQTNGYEEAEKLYSNFMKELAQSQDKELAKAQMSEATAYMANYIKMMGMNAATEEADKEEQKTPAQEDSETALGEGIAAAGTEQELDIVEEMEESALQLSERLQGMDPAQWLLQFGETADMQLQAIRGSELDEQTKAVAETYLASAQRYEGVLLANQEEIDAKVEEAARDFDANVNQELGSVIEVLTPETKDTEGKRAYVIQGNPEEAGTITLRYEDGTTEQTTRAKIAKIVSNENAEAIRPAVIEGVRRTAVAEVAGRMNEHIPNAAETAMFAGHNVIVDGQPGVVADMNQDGTLKVQLQDGKTISAAPQQVMDAQAYNNIMERKARAREGVMYSMPVREEAEAPAAEMAVAEAPVPVEEPTEAQKLLQEYMDESVPLEDRMAIVENNVAQAKQTAIEAQAEVDAMTENKPKAQDYTNIAAYKQALAEWQVQMQDKQQVLDLARQQEATWSEVQKGMVQPVETATEQTSTKAVNEYMVSDEVDENGRAFVYSPNGSIEFGVIGADTGLTPAPILLSEGMITNPSTNDGYGLVHIEARHGDQIRAAGYKSVIEFVNDVAKNYEVIREGRDRNGHQTYMLQLTDKHNNTLMVELSGDGTYWNINTAGIFKTSYGRNRKEVYHRHTTEKQSTETAGVSQGIEQSGTQMPSSMNTPTSSASKDTQSVSAKQTDKKEISANVAESNVEVAKAEAKNHNSKHDIEALAKEIGASKNRIQRVIDFANQVGVKLNFANITRTQGNAGALTNADNMASKREITLSKYMLAKGLPIEWVMGHELTHQIKADGNAENWEAYKQTIKELVGEDTFNSLVAQQADIYRRAGAYKNMPADAFMDAMEEEVCADMAGNVFLNPNNISKVMGMPQSLVSRIWNALKDMVGLGTPKSVLQAVAAWQQLAEGKELAGEEEERKHSISPLDMSEEEKYQRGEMLRNALAVDVQSNTIVATPELSARRVAELWWEENVPEAMIYDTEVGEVEINKNSIESSLAHRYGQKKLDAITSLAEGFENAVYLGTLPDSRERGVVDHYFAYPINYDGKRNYVFCRAMQDANKNRLYVHEVFVEDKITKGNTLQTAASKPHGGISLYRDILANVLSASKDTQSVSTEQAKAEGNSANVAESKVKVTNEVRKHSIVGTTGARALDKAEGTTVRMDNMDVAEEMEAAGKDAETIWLATGWERGADGKWKYEVLEDFAYEEPRAKAERLQEEYQQVQNEKENIYRYLNRFPARGLTEQQKAIKKEQNARLKKLIRQGEQLQEEIIESNFDTTLGELIGTDNNIIRAYPELASMPVSFVKNSRFMDAGLKGAFDGEGIWINPTLESTAPTLLHEVQHAIQRIEGFARGGNTGSVKTKADALREDVRPLHEMMLDTPEWAERQRLQNRWFDETDAAEIAKIEQRVMEINESGVLDAIQSKRKQLQEKYGSDATVGKILSSPYAEDAEIWEQLPESFNDKYEAYRNLAGEAEARNVSARLNMSEEERRQTRPGKTEDVTREEQTVRYSISKEPIGRSLAADEAEILITDMKENADIAPELEFSIENWISEFGKDGLVTTPIGKVKMGENQIAKLLNKNREKRFGLIRPTLQTPDVIVEKHAPAEGAERESKFLFIKTFVKPDGSRFIHFESVTVLKDGMDVSISSHEIGDKALRKEMQNGTILHLNSKLSSGFDKYLTKTPTERPDLAPTSDNRLVISSSLGGGVSPISRADDAAPAISLQSRNDDELSASKDTQSVSTEQTDKKEISEKSAESNVEVTNEEVMHSISPIEGYTYSEVIDMVQNDVENILSEEGADNVEAVEFWAHGSRMRGNAKEDSDLDVVMFYKGNEKEDSLFNLINEHELAIEGIKVDVNPIRISNEQDIARYKEKSARYDQEMRFSLAGLHNISEEKLKKAIKQGGLANPSVAVIDLDTRDHNTYGDITLVLPSYMIDKKQGRNAGTYMGDAWTPTYPRVSMRLDNKGWRKIDEFIASISDDAHMRSNMHYAVEDFMQGGTTPYMQYAFLKTKGIEIPFVYKNNDRYISNEEFKELIGMDALTAFNGSIDAYNKFKELPKEVQDELYIWIINRGDKAKIKAMKESIQKDQRYAKLLDYEVPFSKFNMFANDTFRREQDNGKIDYTKTFSEANNHVATNGLGAEYNAWISNLLEEAGAEEYIFAGFTPSGNAKYLPHTLENVSKVMKKDGKSNAYNNTGYGPTRAGIIKALSTLGQIRKNSDILRTDINTVDEAKEELTERLYELRSKLADMRKLSDNPFINGDYAESRLQEALSRKNPARYLNEEYGYNIEEDGDFAKKLESFIDDVRKAPMHYFETKFERPVMLDEFHAAVIPNDTDAEVIKALEKAGLNVETYERDNDAERKEALLRASDEQVRFSLSADILAANERFNEELDEFKAKTHKGLLHLGKPGAILRTIGVDADEMTLSPSVLSRHLKKHNLTADDLIGLPLSVQTPILAYRHGDKNPNLVVVTEMDVKGGKLSVSLELDENGHVVEIDNIRSVHSKDATKEMARLGAMREGELEKALRWVEKEEVQDWLGIADLNRPIHTINPELSSVANVLLSFQNPPILEDESSQNDANATPGVQKYSLPARPAIPRRNEGEGIMEYAQRVAKATEAQKAWDVANKTAMDIDRQIKNSEEYRDILAQKEPQTIEEAASLALAGGKLLWNDHVDGTKVSKGAKSMMGWGEGERQRFFAMFASKENGGVSVEQMGEAVMDICSQYNIPVDETDAMAGTNAVLEVLQSAQRPSDITGYIEHNRIEQVRRMIEEEQELLASERNRAYMDMYGMTYDDFVEIASTIDAEDEQERSDDKNVIAWLYGQSQRQQERITNAKAELKQMEKFGVSKAKYDAAYRAMEQMKAKVRRTQEMLDEATKELRTAKGQAIRHRKANMRYKARKGQWKQVFQELRKAINGKNIRSIDKNTLNEIMRAVGSADLSGMARLFGEAGMVEDIILGVNMRATQDRIDKLLATKTTALNDKGIATGKSVDASVQAILANVRKTLEGILHHDIENQIHDLRSQNWHIRHNAVGNLSQEQQEQVDANKAKIEELKAELSKELATSTANTEQAVNEQIENLTEQIDKGLRTEEESAELMTTLALKRQMVAIHTSYQDTATVEALLRRKQSELRTNWVALHDGNTPQDKREEYRQKRKALQEQIAGLEAQVREGRQATLDAMRSFADSLEETITTGRTNLKSKMQEQLQRRKEFVAKAIHDVNASGKQMQSVNEADKQENDKLPWYKRMFSPALRTFDYMLQKIATRTYGKDSWLYRQFMLGENGVMAAHDEYLRGMQTAARTLEDKAKEIFGKPYQDVMAESNRKKDIGIEILRDAEDYEPSYIPLKLTKGQATYIYMLWRMRDGFSKLATQGFTEEIMQRIEEYIGPDYIQWADWMQMEYLPMMREKYNARYREIYDTNMAAIDNYVPIRIHGQAIRKEVDLTDATASMPGMQKKNGALIQRTVNVNPIDISNNIFELIGQHIDEMEEFYAYAPVRRDLQYILSSPAFRNLLNTKEPGTFQSLLESARIATKTNQQPESAALKAFNDFMNKTQKGLVSGNIAYRNMTAIKQVLSAPAFIGYSQSPEYLGKLAWNMFGGYLRNLPAMAAPLLPGIGHWAQKMAVEETAKGNINKALGETFRWCMREFPDFRERVTRGSAGDIRLEEKGFSELLDKYTEIGMSANVFIDAVTVSIGLKSIYDYEMKKAEKRINEMAKSARFETPKERMAWISEEMRKARNAAKVQATLFANQTQQSSNPALLSPMQVSKNFMERSLTLYKNSSLGLMRAGIGGMRDVSRYTKDLLWYMKDLLLHKEGKKARRRMIEEYTRMFVQEGFAENEAKKRAISYVNSEARKGAFVALLEGFAMNVIWNLGSKGLLGFMAGGGDDDNKERTTGEMVWDGTKFVINNTFGSAIPFVNDALEGRLPVIGLTTSEAEKAWKDIKKQLDENGISLAFALTGMRYAAKFGGVDMQVWANTMDGYYRLFSETGNSDDKILALMLILNSPHSNRIAVARELYKGKSVEEFQKAIEFAGRYNQPVWTFGREMTDKVESDMVKWYLSDNATDEEKQRMRYIEEMEERIDNLETVEDALEMFDEVSDTELRKKISSKIDQISKPEDTFAEKVDKKKENALAEDDTDMGGYTYMKMADSQDLLEEKRMRAEIDMLRPIAERQKELFEEYGSQSAVYTRFMAEHGAEIRRYKTLKAYSKAIQMRKRKMDEEGADVQALYEDIKELYKDARNI